MRMLKDYNIYASRVRGVAFYATCCSSDEALQDFRQWWHDVYGEPFNGVAWADFDRLTSCQNTDRRASCTAQSTPSG